MKRLLLPALVFGLVFAAVGAPSPAGTLSLSAKASAERKAQRLLRAYVPPKGAVRINAVPKGEHLPASSFGGIFGQRVLRHRIWLVHLPASTFVGYFYRRLRGWHAAAYATSHACACRAVARTAATFAATGFGGRATGRVLQLVAARTHRAGWSLLRADLALVWHLSAAEREDVPAGVREIGIHGSRGKARVVNRHQIATIVRWFDHLPMKEAPLYVGSCPGIHGQNSLTFTFAASHGAVARAIVPRSSSLCSPASYSIRGRAQTPLIAGHVDSQVQKLLGVKLLR